MGHSVKLEIVIQKINRRRSPDDAKFGHPALLFYKGRNEIYEDL